MSDGRTDRVDTRTRNKWKQTNFLAAGDTATGFFDSQWFFPVFFCITGAISYRTGRGRGWRRDEAERDYRGAVSGCKRRGRVPRRNARDRKRIVTIIIVARYCDNNGAVSLRFSVDDEKGAIRTAASGWEGRYRRRERRRRGQTVVCLVVRCDHQHGNCFGKRGHRSEEGKNDEGRAYRRRGRVSRPLLSYAERPHGVWRPRHGRSTVQRVVYVNKVRSKSQ